MTAPSSFKFAIACDTGGAYLEVTSDVIWDEGNIPFQWGRTSGFDQSTRPGLYSFTLANPTGVYSPDNPLSTLATPLTEGMGVNWELNGVWRAGRIRSVQPLFAAGGKVSDSGRVRVTVDDMIGNAARHSITNLPDDMYTAAGGLYMWPFDDASTATSARVIGSAPPLSVGTPGLVAFGASSDIAIGPSTVVAIASPAGVLASAGGFPPIVYGATYGAAWGFWTELDSLAGGFSVTGNIKTGIANWSISTSGGNLTLNAAGGTVTGPAFVAKRPYYLATYATMALVTGTMRITQTLYIDGVSIGSQTFNTGSATVSDDNLLVTQVTISTGSVGTVQFSRLTHSRTRISEEQAGPTAASARLSAIVATTPEIILDTVPTMSPAILGPQGGNTTAAAMDEVLRGEQGGMNVVTTGSLLAPVPKIVTYARDRKRAVDLTVSMNQIQDRPQFVRALTNTVAYATASGPTQSVTYFDPTMPALVGSANTSDQVTLRDHDDLYASASDRLYRGKNVAAPILSFQIDARSFDVNLWTQLVALRPGHRVHITDCLQLNLGYATWDGWVVGGDELHTGETRSLFTIYVQPAWDAPVYGTARYAAGAGVMTLQSNISAGATSLGIVSTGDLFTTNGAHFPQNISIGSGPKAEIVTLSAVSGASSPQTGTISARGVGIVPATAWTAGAAIDVSPLWRYDY